MEHGSLKNRPHSVNNAKLGLAYDVNGSLLALTEKLRNAETKILRKTSLESPDNFGRSKFQSSVGQKGFCFRVRKRKEENDYNNDEEPEMKKCRLETKMDKNCMDQQLVKINEEYGSNDTVELRKAEPNESFIHNVNLMESSGMTKRNTENLKLIENILRNLKKWTTSAVNDRVAVLSDRLGPTPFDLSLWSVLSCTKNLVGEEAFRMIDSKSFNYQAKQKPDYFSWKLKQKDLKFIEQLAIDYLAQSKSADLQCRLSVLVHKMTRQSQANVTEMHTFSSRPQKAKLTASPHDRQPSNLTWNGAVKRKFQCEHCSYQTDNRSHLLRHQSSIHNLFKPYHCYICSKEFSRVEYIKQHFITVHPGVKYDSVRAKNEVPLRDQMQKYPPADVKKSDEVESSLNSHKVMPSTQNGELSRESSYGSSTGNCIRPKPVPVIASDISSDLLCSFCEFSTRDVSSMVLHMENCKTDPNKFPCRLCQEIFPSRASLQVHSAMSHFTILYCCHSCPFYTLSTNTYDWHVASQHSVVKDQTSCPICCHPFISEKELIHHIEAVHLKQSSSACEMASVIQTERFNSRKNSERSSDQCGKPFHSTGASQTDFINKHKQ